MANATYSIIQSDTNRSSAKVLTIQILDGTVCIITVEIFKNTAEVTA
jgi:hypothetical protein